ncbi:uncharacterized protein LOC144639687 isoform X1 [Oculina patagonica]
MKMVKAVSLTFLRGKLKREDLPKEAQNTCINPFQIQGWRTLSMMPAMVSVTTATLVTVR